MRGVALKVSIDLAAVSSLKPGRAMAVEKAARSCKLSLAWYFRLRSGKTFV